jgi:hypothetical protein
MLFDHSHEDRVPYFNTIFLIKLLVVMVYGCRNILGQDEREINGVDSRLKQFITFELIANTVVIKNLVTEVSFGFIVKWVLWILVESFLVSFHLETDAAHFYLFFYSEIDLTCHEFTRHIQLFINVNGHLVLQTFQRSPCSL